MKSVKELRLNNSGVTLLEILITLAIFGMLIAATAPFTFNFYQRYQLDSDRSMLVTILREARTLSLSGQGAANHGVSIASAQFTLFEGPSYAARDTSKDQVFDRFEAVAITGPNEIVFRSLYGKTASVSFTLDNSAKKSKIYVNAEGRIDWE